MITTISDRNEFIGGSEMSMMYAKYHTMTFQKWWAAKLSESPSDSFTNKSMAVGTILEHDIIDLYEAVNGVKGIREAQEVKGMARANTDYIVGKKVSDVKATSKAFEWFVSDAVPINYKRQLIHYMYIFGLPEASIIAYQVDSELLSNPFNRLDPNKLFEIPVKVTEKEIEEHRIRLEYLEHCKEMNIFPV